MKYKIMISLAVAVLFTLPHCKKTISDPMLLSRDIFKDLSSTLMKAVAEEAQKNGFPAAVAFCSENGNKKIKEKADLWREKVIKEHGYKGLKVARRTLKPRNQNNLATGEAAEILQQWETEGSATPVLRTSEGAARVYTPIKIGSPMCLNCHGNDSEVKGETAKVLAQKYPEDKARDYKLGDLRGLFLVELVK